jgi:hypothetical protein
MTGREVTIATTQCDAGCLGDPQVQQRPTQNIPQNEARAERKHNFRQRPGTQTLLCSFVSYGFLSASHYGGQAHSLLSVVTFGQSWTTFSHHIT